MRSFPYAQILVLAFVRFAEPITFTSLFPYCYFMVRDFGVARTEAEVSVYSGYLSSIFAFFQMLMGFQWGRFADQYGRKPTIFIGLIGSIISSLILGFAGNYWWALFARAVMGSLNGNVAVIRTMLGEVATERKHQAIAFSVMPMIWQFGSIIGPLIGGYLSGNDTRYDFLRPLVTAHPYALPNITVALFVLACLFVMLFFLEETHFKHKYRHDYFVEIGDFILRVVFGVKPKDRPWHNTRSSLQSRFKNQSHSANEESPLLEEGDNTEDQPQPLYSQEARRSVHRRPSNSSDDSIEAVGTVLSRRQSRALVRAYSMHEEGDEDNASWSELLTPAIFYAIVCSFIMALHMTVFEEFIPVFLAYEVARDETGALASKFPFKISGGLGYTSEDTGALLSSTGVLGVFLIVVVFPYIDRHYESIATYRRFISIFPFLYLVIPYVVFFADHPTASHLVVYSITCLKTLAVSMANPQIFLIIHNCSPQKHRALVNGATISVNALARCVAPAVWGYLMTWGEKGNIAWLPWWSVVFLTLLSIYQARFLRDSNDEDEES